MRDKSLHSFSHQDDEFGLEVISAFISLLSLHRWVSSSYFVRLAGRPPANNLI